MTTACAWCSQELGRVDPPDTSHSICSRHIAELLAPLRKPFSPPPDTESGRTVLLTPDNPGGGVVTLTNDKLTHGATP